MSLHTRGFLLEGLPIQEWVIDGLTYREFNCRSQELADLYSTGGVLGCIAILKSAKIEGSAVSFGRRVLKNPVIIPTVVVATEPQIVALFNVVATVIPRVFQNIKLASNRVEAEKLLLDMVNANAVA